MYLYIYMYSKIIIEKTLKSQANNMSRYERAKASEILMEGPLFIYPSSRESVAKLNQFDDGCMGKLEKSVALDNKHDFVEQINNLPSDLLNENLRQIRRFIFDFNSPDCAAAVLDGETVLTKIPAVTAWLSQLDNGPLFRSASWGSCFVTGLLLQRGFSAYTRGDCTRIKLVYSTHENFVLPLVLSCAKLRYMCMMHNSMERRSPPNIVRKLCCDQSRCQLENLRLLCENTNTSDVKEEFFKYLKEGKTYEVAALLLVAKSRVLSSSTVEVEGKFQSISAMHNFLRCHLSFDAKNNKDNLVDIEDTLVLLEIFDKIGDKLTTLLRLDLSVTLRFYNCATLVAESLIESAGYEVKPKCIFYTAGSSGGFNGNVTYSEDIQVKSNRVLKGIDKCKKKFQQKQFITTDLFPSWVKETALRGLDGMLGNTSPLPVPVRSSVQVSLLASRSQVPMPENMTPLLKKTTPLLGAIKRVLRPA